MQFALLSLCIAGAMANAYGYAAPEIRITTVDAPAAPYEAPAVVRTADYGYSAPAVVRTADYGYSAPAVVRSHIPIVRHLLSNDNYGNYNLE